MLIINSVEQVQDILDRALEIQATELLPWRKALAAAVHRVGQEQRQAAMELRKADAIGRDRARGDRGPYIVELPADRLRGHPRCGAHAPEGGMITLETPQVADELLALMAELQHEGLDEDTSFVVACAELPALLTVDPAETFVPRRVVLFDDAGMPSSAWYD